MESLQLLHRINSVPKRQGRGFSGIHARLTGEIVTGDSPQRLETVIEQFKTETLEHPGSNDAPWSDIAASYLVLAQRQDNPAPLFDALEAADRAVEANNKSTEALFNRALILEYLSLWTSARTAWNVFLDLETDSDWIGEAREHLTRLTLDDQKIDKWNVTTDHLVQEVLTGNTSAAAILARWAPERARQLVQRELLTRWANTAQSHGESENGNHILLIANAVAKELRLIYGDHFLSDSLAAIDAAATKPKRLALLRRGYAELSEGLTLYEERKHFERASVRLKNASTLLKAGNSPSADWSDLYLAACEYSRSLPGISSALLASLASRPNLNLYPSVAARVQWQLGLSQFARGERESALRSFEHANRAFRQIGDRESVAAIQDLLASAYDSIGEKSLSLKYRYLALRNLRWVKGLRRRWVILKTTAESFLERNHPNLAIPILDELLRISSTDPEARAQALFRRSIAFTRLGRNKLASLDESDAKSTIDHIENPSIRSRLKIDFLIEQVEAILPHEPAVALRLLKEPIQFYRKAQNELLLSRALLLRARAALANGDEIESEQNLTEALRYADRQWRKITDPHFKLSFLGEFQSTFDDLLWNQYTRDPSAAFATTERARSPILLERSGGQPLSAAEVQRALPPNTMVVEYALDRHLLLVWTLSRDRVFFSTVHWNPDYWLKLIRSLNESAQRKDEPAFRSTLAELYKLLIQPISYSLPPNQTLVFVPDGAISNAPFPALFNSSTGRYLVESHTVVVAPSASVFVAATFRIHPKKNRPFSLLAVGAPEVDKGWHPNLGFLPTARDEVFSISHIFNPYGSALVGRQATPEAVSVLLGQSDIVHFAAHALIDAINPERSFLALTPTNVEPSSGDLQAASIERLSLFNSRLVVLAVCSGAAGRTVKGEGTLSLARSFLYAGAPTVVAALWPISDQSKEFFHFFYSTLRSSGCTPSKALRLTQIYFLKSNILNRRCPWIWGGIQAYGAT